MCRMSGREFRSAGPATANARCPNLEENVQNANSKEEEEEVY